MACNTSGTEGHHYYYDTAESGRMFYSDFGLFYQVPMRSGMISSVTDTIDVFVYKGLTQLNDIGRSSAAGFLQSVLGFILVLAANAIVRKIDEENALF